MKKLSNSKAKKIHPSPSSNYPFLTALPAALLAVAAALSPEEKEVLLHLLSDGPTGRVVGRSVGNKKPNQSPAPKQSKTHPPELGCGCFGCYKSFWARWNNSPNRHLIHQILDAVEENLEDELVSCSRRRRRRGNGKKGFCVAEEVRNGGEAEGDYEFGGFGKIEEEEGDVRDSVRKFLSFVGERIWGVWNS